MRMRFCAVSPKRPPSGTRRKKERHHDCLASAQNRPLRETATRSAGKLRVEQRRLVVCHGGGSIRRKRMSHRLRGETPRRNRGGTASDDLRDGVRLLRAPPVRRPTVRPDRPRRPGGSGLRRKCQARVSLDQWQGASSFRRSDPARHRTATAPAPAFPASADSGGTFPDAGATGHLVDDSDRSTVQRLRRNSSDVFLFIFIFIAKTLEQLESSVSNKRKDLSVIAVHLVGSA